MKSVPITTKIVSSYPAHDEENRISGVMVSMLSSVPIYREFEPWSGQTKDYKIGISFFSA
jgi:hypothetical protein